MINKTLPDLSHLSQEQLIAMREAGLQILECYRVLKKSADNIVGEILRGNEPFIELDHYPPGDIYDPASHSQYYYHAHREGEHGHFHTFLRQQGMAENLKPIWVTTPVTWSPSTTRSLTACWNICRWG